MNRLGEKLLLITAALLSFGTASAQLRPPAAPFEDGLAIFFAAAVILGVYKLRKKRA